MTVLFSFLVTQYLLKTHYVLGCLLGAKDATGTKTDTLFYVEILGWDGRMQRFLSGAKDSSGGARCMERSGRKGEWAAPAARQWPGRERGAPGLNSPGSEPGLRSRL